MRLSRSPLARAERVKAFDAEQLARFLRVAEERTPDQFPLFFVLSRTGLRLGEALALEWGDLDLVRREMRVARAVSTQGRIDTPKSGHGRTVDLGVATCDLLRSLKARMSAAALARGARLKYVFPDVADKRPMPHVTPEKAFKRALAAAGLSNHYSPHSLRHTYASLLLQEGVSPAYVQEQLGHSSIELTVGTYGRWLRKRAPGAVDRIDRAASDAAPGTATNEVVANPPEVVATAATGAGEAEAPASPNSRLFKKVAERGGFEPPVQVNPAQQVSNLARSATPAPLRGRQERGAYHIGRYNLRVEG